MRCWVVNENIGMTVISGRFLYGKLPFPPLDTGVSMRGHCSFPPRNRGFTYEYLLSLVETEIIGLFMCCR